jgi:glycerol-1-phosphate dehydrogenase [NAD(P)+]
MIAEQLERLTAGERPAEGLAPMEIRRLCIGPDALDELVPIVEALGGTRITVLQDATRMTGPEGIDLKPAIAAMLAPLGSLVVETLPGDVHADEVTVERAVTACAGADVVVTVGSGTMSDIGKVAAAAAGAPHVIVQTAASVDGFADDQSVLLKRGVKRTVHSAWPHALVADAAVVRQAPIGMSLSGLGDATTMFTAPADWYLANVLDMGDGWVEPIGLLARAHGDRLLALAPGIGARDGDAIQMLTSLLALRGMVMGMARQTSPGSGMEHTVSHLLDMRAGADGIPTAPHGAQVGVSTIVGARLWRRIVAIIDAGDLPPVAVPDDAKAERLVRSAFLPVDASGAMADECWADYRVKLDRMRRVGLAGRVQQLVDDWPTHRAMLDRILVPPHELEGALRLAGAPVRYAQLPTPPSDDAVRWAFANCHLMRARFTVADLAFLTGLWTTEHLEDALRDVLGPAPSA